MKCPGCGKDGPGGPCDACSGDPVRQAFARGGSITVEELRGLMANPKGKPNRHNKYGAVPTVVDGIRFHSKREAARWGELNLLLKAGKIRDLRRQVRFKLSVSTVETTTYIADFVYEEDVGEAEWPTVVEDCKGFRTDMYKMKAQMMAAQFGILIRET